MSKKSLFSLFLLLSSFALLIFLPFIVTDTPFLIGYDSKTQYFQFFEELRTMMSDGNLFYRFNLFLGNDFFSSRLFLNYDVFDYLFAFFQFDYFTASMISIYFRILIGGFSFYWLTTYYVKQAKHHVFFSLLYVFSGWAIFNFKDQLFFSFYCFLPLYYIAMESYFKNKNAVGFTLIVAYLTIDNYYLFYTVILLTPFYYVVRYTTLKLSRNEMWNHTIKLIVYFLIGIGIASFSLIPNVIHILQNSRVGESTSLLYYESIIPYLQMLISPFSFQGILGNTSSGLYHTLSLDNTVIWIISSSSVIVSLIFLQSVLDSTYKYCRRNRKVLAVLIILHLSPAISSFLHGFSAPNYRWTFFSGFLVLLLSFEYVELVGLKIKKSVLWIVGLIFIIFVVSIYLFKIMLTESDLFFISMGGVISVTAFVFIIKQWNGALHGLICTEITISILLGIGLLPANNTIDQVTWNRYEVLLGEKGELSKLLFDLDYDNYTSFYRVYLPYESVGWSISLNTNLLYDIPATSSYDSSYSTSIDDLDQLTHFRWSLDWMLEISDPHVLDFVDVKYAIVSDDSQLPHDQYSYVQDYYYFKIFQNLNYNNFGFLAYQVESLETTKGGDQINSTVLALEKDIDEIDEWLSNHHHNAVQSLDYVYQEGNGVQFEVDANGDSFFVSSIPANQGFKVLVDGEEVKTYSVNGGFIGFMIPEGYHTAAFYFTPRGLREGIIISGISMLLILGMILRKRCFLTR